MKGRRNVENPQSGEGRRQVVAVFPNRGYLFGSLTGDEEEGVVTPARARRLVAGLKKLRCDDGTTPEINIRISPSLYEVYIIPVNINDPSTVTVILSRTPEESAEIDKIFSELVVESKKPGHTGDAPPSSPPDTPREGMRENDLNTKIKNAKAENLARGSARPATLQLATYKALVKNVDLLNLDLPEAERLTRTRRLVHAYERLHARRPNFNHHNNKQLLAAFSIVNKEKYRRGQAKKAAQKVALGM